MDKAAILLHATAVAIGGHGLLLIGPSGSGKSELALQLIDLGAQLVADDQTRCAADGGRLLLSPPATIAGLLEVRGVGLVRQPWVTAPARLLLDCGAVPERLPAPASCTIAGIAVPVLNFDAHAPSAAAKARAALALAAAGALWQEHPDGRA